MYVIENSFFQLLKGQYKIDTSHLAYTTGYATRHTHTHQLLLHSLHVSTASSILSFLERQSIGTNCPIKLSHRIHYHNLNHTFSSKHFLVWLRCFMCAFFFFFFMLEDCLFDLKIVRTTSVAFVLLFKSPLQRNSLFVLFCYFSVLCIYMCTTLLRSCIRLQYL